MVETPTVVADGAADSGLARHRQRGRHRRDPGGGLMVAQEQRNRISRLDLNDKPSVFLDSTHGTRAIAIDATGRVLSVERAVSWSIRI